jgi:tetratricopeptide (TPR) repeat protein
LNRAGRYKDSLPHFEQAVQSNPGLDVAHFRLAQAYQRLGLKEKARVEFEIFEKLQKQDQADKEKQAVIQFLIEQSR